MEAQESWVTRASQFGALSAVLLLWLAVSWFIADSVMQKASQSLVKRESSAAEWQAQNIAKNVAQSIAYLHGVPLLIAKDDRTLRALLRSRAKPALASMAPEAKRQTGSENTLLNAMDGHLDLVARSLGVDALWIMNASGDVVAASNAGKPQSFVGTNCADWEYFTAAMAGKRGQQYAMGRDTNIPGLYFSAPVAVDGRIIGVVAAKTDVPRLSFWVNQADAFISDMYGIVILATDPNLEMHAIPGASVRTLSSAERLARYKRTDLPFLPIRSWDNPRFPGLLRFGEDAVPTLMARHSVPDNDIEVHAFKRLPAVVEHEKERLQQFLLLAVSGSVLLLIVAGSVSVALIQRQARRSTAQSLSLQRATIESTADGILVVDNDGHVKSYNQRFVDIWQIPPDLLSSHSDQKLLDFVCAQLAEPESFLAKVHETYARPGDSSFDALHFRDGRTVERYSQPQRLDGKVMGRVWSFRDITERKRAEDKLAQSELKLQTIIDTEPECVKLVAADGTLLQMNRAGLEMIDADAADQVVGKKLETLIAPQHRRAFAALNRRVFEGKSGNLEFEIVGLKGTRRWLESRAVPLRDPNGKISALLAVTRDITERKRTEHALRIAATAFESTEAMVVTDASHRILQVNRAFTELTGYAADEVIGKTTAFLKSGRQDDEFYRQMWQRLDQSGYWQGEIWDRRKNGEIFPMWLAISAVRGPDGAVTNYVGASTDITQRKESEDQIRSLAFFDSLTKLPNRWRLLDRLEHALAASQRSGRYGAVMFLDVDNFKALNDTQGHAVGDLLLVEVAQRLQASIRDGDTVSRLGGDEFIIMLEELSEDWSQAAAQVEAVAEKIQDAFNRPYALRCGEDGRTKDFHCTASIGISLFLGHMEKPDELLKRADVAMYEAKSAGRNTVRFFDPDMQEALEARTAMEGELRHALANGEFEFHYQVQVDRQQRLIGAEVLLRWNNPVRGIVSPAAFIPLAEETGLIVPIGLWVLHSACVRLKAWSADPARRDLQLAVNISARQFRQDNFISQVMEVLAQTGADPSRLKLELTEGLVLDNVEDAIEKMLALRALGIEFSMDDFGAGYSSLSYLKRLPLSELKIDHSFIKDLGTDSNDAAIVRTIITMGRTLGLEVIAEGVEREEQREFLRHNGCSAFQGYLFGRPLPWGEFEQLLKWHSGVPSPAHLRAK